VKEHKKGGIVFFLRKTLREFEQLGFSKEETEADIIKEKGTGVISITFGEKIGTLVRQFIEDNPRFCQFKDHWIFCAGNVLTTDSRVFPFVNCILAEILKNEKGGLVEFGKRETERIIKELLKEKIEDSGTAIKGRLSYSYREKEFTIRISTARLDLSKKFLAGEEDFYKIIDWIDNSIKFIKQNINLTGGQ
jgi:hypothetical protein